MQILSILSEKHELYSWHVLATWLEIWRSGEWGKVTCPFYYTMQDCKSSITASTLHPSYMFSFDYL